MELPGTSGVTFPDVRNPGIHMALVTRYKYRPVVPGGVGATYLPNRCQIRIGVARMSLKDTSYVSEQPRYWETESTAARPAGSDALSSPKFNWYKQWYPLAVVEDLDPSIPHPTHLLGEDLVLWRDQQGTWRCFLDRCPHRLAPLSEGRLDQKTGDLYCNYHGWQFKGSGGCTNIPQLPPGQQINTKRACATTFPTRVAEGLVWVWGEPGPAAFLEATASEFPGIAPEIDVVGEMAFSGKTRWYMRDLHVPYIAAKENAFNDPSHDTVLHHGVAGVREMAAPLTVDVVEMTPTGYIARWGPAGGPQSCTSIVKFPSGSRLNTMFMTGVAYVVPTDRGKCRQFHSFLKGAPVLEQLTGQGAASATSSSGPSVRLPFSAWLRRKLLALRPRWAAHVYQHDAIDADAVMQFKVDLNRVKNGRMYMAAECDRQPGAFKRWMEKYGGGGPPVGTLKDPIDPEAVSLSRMELLDRYHQHTTKCRSCRVAHKNVSLIAACLGPLATAMLAATLASLVIQGGAVITWALAVGTGVLVWAARMIGQLKQRFEFLDYDQHHVSKLP